MNKLINTITKKEIFSNPPIWIMRQAGRYLPEYRELRSKASNFLDFCYNPKLASEVTLQPLKRFDLDAAIIFSDILVIPDALGVKVEFIKDIGPKLQKVSTIEDLNKLRIDAIKNHLQPVFDNIKLVKSQLKSEKALIGFSGSPWTLASYMIEGGGSKNFEEIRQKSIKNEDFFAKLLDILTKSVIEYLSYQIEAGVDVVKLFDSWAGILPPREVKKWVIEPNKKIVEELKKRYPHIPIICFPRGIGFSYEEFVSSVKCDAIALDQNVNLEWARDKLQNVTIQGNLDNFLLAFGSKKEIEEEVLRILEIFKNKSFIFNLGHGILPQTPIENVEFLIKLIRENGDSK